LIAYFFLIYKCIFLDDLNECYYKQFYCLNQAEYDWWISLEEQIKGKTGLPFEEVIIEEGEGFDD